MAPAVGAAHLNHGACSAECGGFTVVLAGIEDLEAADAQCTVKGWEVAENSHHQVDWTHPGTPIRTSRARHVPSIPYRRRKASNTALLSSTTQQAIICPIICPATLA